MAESVLNEFLPKDLANIVMDYKSNMEFESTYDIVREEFRVICERKFYVFKSIHNCFYVFKRKYDCEDLECITLVTRAKMYEFFIKKYLNYVYAYSRIPLIKGNFLFI